MSIRSLKSSGNVRLGFDASDIDDGDRDSSASSESSSSSAASALTPQSKAASTANEPIRPTNTLFRPQALDNVVSGVRRSS
jgi:hypothetical protein